MSGAGVRIASWNVHKAVGTDRRRDPSRISRVIAEIAPDLMALQETDIRLFGARSVLDRGALAGAGLRRVPVPGVDGDRGWYGNALLAGRDVDVGEVRAVRLPGLEPRGAVVADLLVRGVPLRAVAAHLALDPVSRRRQARIILGALIALPGMPTVMAADTNEWRWAPGALSPLHEHLTDAPIAATFPSWRPLLPLDRIMMRGGEVRDFGPHLTETSRKASDHLPVKATLIL